jgi:hypothetical protein
MFSETLGSTVFVTTFAGERREVNFAAQTLSSCTSVGERPNTNAGALDVGRPVTAGDE